MIQAHRDYFNRLAPEWDSLMPEDPSLREFLVQFGITRSDSVLDVGAGTGRITSILTDLVGDRGQVVALDISDAMVRLGYKKYRHTGSHWLCGDIHSLGMKCKTFTKIICFSAFPHFHDDSLALTEMHRVLQPNGKLLIWHTRSSVSLNDFHASLDGVVQHDRLPPIDELGQLVTKSGFSLIQLEESDAMYWIEAKKLI